MCGGAVHSAADAPRVAGQADAAPGAPRVLVVIGTRPEAIKLAPVVDALRASPLAVDVVASGQHTDLLDAALAPFGICPDHRLALPAARDLSDLTAGILLGMRSILAARPYAFVVVQGDTTTALAAGLAAFYARIPLAHVEGGLRTSTPHSPFPEEANRRMVSRMAALHFVPTESGRANLLAEGTDPSTVHITGNTAVDAFSRTLPLVRSLSSQYSSRFPFLDPAKRLVLVTGHRRENHGAGLEGICTAALALASRGDVQVAFTLHPNPHVRGPAAAMLAGAPDVHTLEPQDYRSFVYLMSRSSLILTDSGGIQEEAPLLGIPVLVLREETERHEAVEGGTARVVGTDAGRIAAEAGRLLDDAEAYAVAARVHSPFGDGRAAGRIAEVLCGYLAKAA